MKLAFDHLFMAMCTKALTPYPIKGDTPMQDIEIRAGAIRPADCVGEAFEAIKPNYFLFVGMTLVLFIILFIVSAIPYIGSIVQIIITGPLFCGLYMAFLAQMNEEPVDFSMLFSGFSRSGPAILITLIPIVPFFVLGIGIVLFGTFGTQFLINERGQNLNWFSGGLIFIMIVMYMATLAIYLLMFFGLPLIADRNVGIADAVKLSYKAAVSNVGGIILLFIIQMLVALIGVLALCVGVIFAAPVIYAMNAVAYRMVFPNTESKVFQEPPRPDEYSGLFGTQG